MRRHRSLFVVFFRTPLRSKSLRMKNLIAILAVTTAAAQAHPGHPGHETGDIGWGSHPILGITFIVLLIAALSVSRRAPRILAGACAAIAAVTLVLVR